MPAGTQNAVIAITAAPNQPATDHLAFQLQASDNLAMINAQILFLAEPTATIPVVTADKLSTVAALFTVQPVALQRVNAQRYVLKILLIF